MVVFGPFRRRVVLEAMWWDGYYCVYVRVGVEWYFLWCPIIVINY